MEPTLFQKPEQVIKKTVSKSKQHLRVKRVVFVAHSIYKLCANTQNDFKQI